MTLHPCPIDDGIEDVNVREVVETCHQCSMDVCIAKIEYQVERATVGLIERNARRRLQQQMGEPR